MIEPTSDGVLAARIFTAADQERFATLSGDRNPMHVDARYARRTQAGACVVHGVHAVLWGLDVLGSCNLLGETVSSIDVSFAHFVYVGTQAILTLIRRTPSALHAAIVSDGLTAVRIDVGFGPARSDAANAATRARPAPIGDEVAVTDPWSGELEDMAGRCGRIACPPGRIARDAPALAARISDSRVEAIGRLSYLVGMVCPGMHSIFNGLSVSFGPTGDGDLAFAVIAVDDRFRLIETAFDGGGICGTLTAFVRHPPIAQRSLEDLRSLVGANEFSGTRALIVGGSRGLGALTARTLAAGGGRVAITYRSGAAEADEIVSQIGSERGVAFAYDTSADPSAQLASLPWEIEQLYYFASPPIYRQRGGLFSADRFAEFCDVYIGGFERLLRALAIHGKRLVVFYPSSTALDDRPRNMTEYAMAKAAGEVLCADINRYMRGFEVLVRRLPRVLTDQTATVMPVESSDAFAVMAPIVREMATAVIQP